MKKALRDPNSRGFWSTIVVFTVMCVPYLFAGKADPVVAGVPLWFWISVLSAVGVVVTTFAAIRRWQLGSLAGDRDEHADG